MSQADAFQAVRRKLGEAGLELVEAKSPEAMRLRLRGKPVRFVEGWRIASAMERGLADSLTKVGKKPKESPVDARADVEIVVRLKRSGNEIEMEWDYRPDPMLRRRLRADSTWRALLALGVVAVPAAILGSSINLGIENSWGLLVMLLTFLFIPPLTVYSVLEYARAAYVDEGARRAGKEIEELLAKGFPGISKVKKSA